MRKVIIILVILVSAVYSVLTVWFGFSLWNTMVGKFNMFEISNKIGEIRALVSRGEIEKVEKELMYLDRKISFLLVSQEEIFRNAMNSVIRTSGATFLVFVLSSVLLSLLITRQLRLLVDFLTNFKFPVSLNIAFPKPIFKDIGKISLSFQNLVSRLVEYEKRVAELERFEGWRDVSKVMVHEVGNLLTPVYTEVKNSIQSGKGLNVETIRRIDKILDNINQFLSKIREISSLPKPVPRKENLISILEELRLFFQFEFESGESEVFVMVDRVLLMNAFVNILKNSFEATDGKGIVRVSVSRDGDSAIVRFWDNGGGIPKEILDKIFDFGVSYKKGGRGIGLAITRKIILESYGDITVNSSVSEGTTEVVVRLPVVS
ncbi:MAG: sensor histidine kinase [Spirochaetia bacterium]|nr:sensor histidine kinase [Spirochaetota bacterium]MDW8112033.1 sensor histidine kinase [Spirochaetia bacterium]